MNPLAPSRLIPRNNWDIGLSDLFFNLGAAVRPSQRPEAMQRVYGSAPVWTRSGRASLYAILKGLDLPAGAKVGVPLYCCSVVFNAIVQAGCVPYFLDCNPDDGNLSAADVAKKRGELSAVVVVHMYGNPSDMDAINAAAAGLPVIEDCAQAAFSTYHGRPAGTLSTASFFSFRCGKYISAGEGSPIFCRDEALRARIAAVARDFPAWSKKDLVVDAVLNFVKATMYHRPWYGLIGYPVGMRLDKKLNLTAKDGFETGQAAATHRALAEKRFATFQHKIDIQREHARMLLERIQPGPFCLPAEGPGRESSWFQFALRFDTPEQRDAMCESLFQRGIDTSKYLDTIAEDARAQYGYTGGCPNAEHLAKTGLLIPIHYTLSKRDIETIAQAINESARSL